MSRLTSSSPTTEQGFSLLEVMVSLAILSISLVAILNLHSGAVRMHNHAKFVSMATLLARSKMVERLASASMFGVMGRWYPA